MRGKHLGAMYATKINTPLLQVCGKFGHPFAYYEREDPIRLQMATTPVKEAKDVEQEVERDSINLKRPEGTLGNKAEVARYVRLWATTCQLGPAELRLLLASTARLTDGSSHMLR